MVNRKSARASERQREKRKRAGKGPASAFSAEVADLVKTIGNRKYADLSATERHYFLSLRIRQRITLWLHWHEGETFSSPYEMAIGAANEAYCSSLTSRRWLDQYTYEGMPWKLVALDDGDYQLMSREGFPSERVRGGGGSGGDRL